METNTDPPTPAADSHPRLGWVCWLLPIVAFAWCYRFAIDMPEPAEWWFLRLEDQPPLSLDSVFAAEQPAYLTHRWIYAGAIATGISFELLRFAPFLTALLWFVVARLLLRRIAGGAPRTLWIGDVLIAAWIFHPTWGSSWLMFGRYREFLPLLLFTTALLTLFPRQGTEPSKGYRRRWLTALGCVLLAQASHPSGICMFLAMGPAVCSAARMHQISQPRRSAVLFVGWAAVGALVVWFGLRGSSLPGLIHFAVDNPIALVERWLTLTAGAIPPILTYAGIQALIFWSATFLILIVALLTRRPFGMRRGTVTTMTLFGVIAFASVVDQYYAARPVYGVPPSTLSQEALVPLGILLFGLAGLLYELSRRWWQPISIVLLGGGAVAFAVDWQLSFEHLKTAHCMLRAQQAELSLSEAAPQFLQTIGPPPKETRLSARILASEDLVELRSHGSLANFPKLPGLDLAGYPPPSPEPCGEFLGLVTGKMRGVVRGTLLRPAVRLVYVVRERGPQRLVIGVMRPDFLASIRSVPTTGEAPPQAQLKPGDRVMAFGLELEPMELRPLRGVYEVTAAGLERQEDLPR